MTGTFEVFPSLRLVHWCTLGSLNTSRMGRLPQNRSKNIQNITRENCELAQDAYFIFYHCYLKVKSARIFRMFNWFCSVDEKNFHNKSKMNFSSSSILYLFEIGKIGIDFCFRILMIFTERFIYTKKSCFIYLLVQKFHKIYFGYVLNYKVC